MLYLDKDKNGDIVFKELPFKSKYTKDGKLYRKKYGFKHQLSSGQSSIEIACPYDLAKINTAQFVWFPEGVTADFFVLDSESGIYQQAILGVPQGSITPKAILSQHGFGACIASGEDTDVSEYDATLLKDMIIKVDFENPGQPKEVGINFVFHEVKQ